MAYLPHLPNLGSGLSYFKFPSSFQICTLFIFQNNTLFLEFNRSNFKGLVPLLRNKTQKLILLSSIPRYFVFPLDQ